MVAGLVPVVTVLVLISAIIDLYCVLHRCVQGGLTSRVCVFTKGTSPSRIVPSYNLLQVAVPTLQILRMVSAQEDMFVCMRTTARGAARRGSSRRPLQKGQEIETGGSATAS